MSAGLNHKNLRSTRYPIPDTAKENSARLVAQAGFPSECLVLDSQVGRSTPSISQCSGIWTLAGQLPARFA